MWLLWRLPQLGCVSQDSEASVSQTGKVSRGNPCKKPWNRFEEYDSLSLRCVKQVSGKTKAHRLENTSQSSSSAKSQCFEIWGLLPCRDWKTTAMCPKQGLEPCQTHVQARRKGQSYILPTLEKEPEEREFVVDSGASYAYGQQARP